MGTGFSFVVRALLYHSIPFTSHALPPGRMAQLDSRMSDAAAGKDGRLFPWWDGGVNHVWVVKRAELGAGGISVKPRIHLRLKSDISEA